VNGNGDFTKVESVKAENCAHTGLKSFVAMLIGVRCRKLVAFEIYVHIAGCPRRLVYQDDTAPNFKSKFDSLQSRTARAVLVYITIITGKSVLVDHYALSCSVTQFPPRSSHSPVYVP